MAHHDALRSMIDGSLGGKREQTILTPWLILERVIALWSRIYCDNCWTPESLTNPEVGYRLDIGQNGLSMEAAPPKTFTNPPFGAKSRKQLPLGGYKQFLELYARSPETILLGPVRTQRGWYIDNALELSHAVCWLRPFAFVGFEQVFPTPLALHYRGPDPMSFVHLTDDRACKASGQFGGKGIGRTELRPLALRQQHHDDLQVAADARWTLGPW